MQPPTTLKETEEAVSQVEGSAEPPLIEGENQLEPEPPELAANPDLDRLHRELGEHKQITQQALLKASEANRKLERAGAELEELRLNAPPIPKGKRPQSESELSLRDQWNRALAQIEKERRAARQAEARFTTQVASLERDLVAARAVARAEQTARVNSRNYWIRVTVSTTAGIALVCLIGLWWSLRQTSSVSDRSSAPSANPGAAVAQEHPSEAVERFNRALKKFPNTPPADVLRQAQRNHPAIDPSKCVLVWNNGQPSLVFGGEKSSKSFASTLTGCAQAIEGIHSEIAGQ